MQEYQRPDGSRFKQIFHADTVEKLREKLDENRRQMEAEGNTFLGERRLTKNSKCPCGSGKKIKRCCRFIQ